MASIASAISPARAIPEAISSASNSLGLAKTLAAGLETRARNRIRGRLQSLVSELAELQDAIGPLKHPPFVFDPAAFDVIAHVAASALLAQPALPLAKDPEHWGSGIYALYYDGPLDFYAAIARTDTPIYVGTAAPSQHSATSPVEQGDSLFARVIEHRGSIQEVEDYATGNLKVGEFRYRSLVVTSGWELAAEQYLIRFFRPAWNKETKICTGLGKHGDASTTRQNLRSQWDTVHPGRPWAWTAETRPNRRSQDEIEEDIRQHFNRHPPRTLNIQDILR